ncbi:pectinesterase inhibitor 6 [Hevea brasiliensis]|uniref:pectinesterase inhibitor 6 n=1 Tax=Hevea brasiliensis TaxID=3981 RepID=UPI0025E0BB42|nr:pectinesterase inhibitor 6 [Hevea brasiliensis]
MIGSTLVEQVCDYSHNKANCIEGFGSEPESEQANLQQLRIMALKLASKNATDTALYIKRMLKDASTLDAATKQALIDCAEQCGVDVNQQLASKSILHDGFVAALLANAQHDVYAWVSAAITDVDSCEYGFNENGSQDFLLAARNAMFRQLCNNALAINKLLSDQSNTNFLMLILITSIFIYRDYIYNLPNF